MDGTDPNTSKQFVKTWKSAALTAKCSLRECANALLVCYPPYHEISNRPVEDRPIVVTFFTQTDKVLSSFRNLVKKKKQSQSFMKH